MKNVFDYFIHLWPPDRREALASILKEVAVLNFPQDQELIRKGPPQVPTLVIFESGSLAEVFEVIRCGYLHVVQRERPDFQREVLAASLMLARPMSFLNKPVPFFLNGFEEPQGADDLKTSLRIPLRRSSDKLKALDLLGKFLDQRPQLGAIKELCLQSADEQISNALFSAPTRVSGEPLYQHIPRAAEIALPDGKEATLFACFSQDRVLVGCEDLYGSIKKDQTMAHLQSIFAKNKLAPNRDTAGAGLGFRYMIENAANFYLFMEPQRRTIVACGFLLSGMKPNLKAVKHIHLGFPPKR